MTRSTDELIDRLGADAAPVRPLASPMRRSIVALALLVLIGMALVSGLSGPELVGPRAAGRELAFAAEQIAMGLTAILAVIAAFHLSIPGRSRKWAIAPLPSLLVWLAMSGWGCLANLSRDGFSGWAIGESGDCFAFILATGALIGAPLIWRLSQARPIDPLPVALTGGLGAAAIAALLLQFFHPFAVGLIDLAIHLAAIAIVVGVAALFRRRMAPAG